MRGLVRAAFVFVCAVTVTIGLASCTAPAEKTVDHTAESVTLAPGEALVIDFGEVNGSVGEEWVLTQEPDGAVLGPGERRSRYLGEDGMTGAPSEVTYRFAPVEEGATMIEFEYRFRGSVPEDLDERKTARIEVTVQ